MWEHRGGASVGIEDALLSSLHDTERRGVGVGVKDEGMAVNTKITEQKRHGRMGLGDWMLKRDYSQEDLNWTTERKQLGGELSSDATIELRAEKERERQRKRLITVIIG